MRGLRRVGEVYTTGSWKPCEGQEEAFVEAWCKFAEWVTSMPGAGAIRLSRDLRDPERFVSFARWESIEAVTAWKSSPEFKERMSKVQQHVDEFAPTELEVVMTVDAHPARA
jgi:heme-degrading monooxygenase HmoA